MMMRKGRILTTALAVVLAAGLAIGSAAAYFTSFVTAAGTVPVTLGSKTTFSEPDVDTTEWLKELVVENKGPADCYVRATAFAGSQFELNYSGTGWEENEDGYWYYSEILGPGDSSEKLVVQIGNVPEEAVEGDGFNVVVIYESAQVLYDADGEPYPADWTMEANVVEEGGES